MVKVFNLNLLRRPLTLTMLVVVTLAVALAPLSQRPFGASKALALGYCPPALPQCTGGQSTGPDPDAKKTVIGIVIFEYQPSGGGDTADIVFPHWQGMTEAGLWAFNRATTPGNPGYIPPSYTQSDKDDMWSKIWGSSPGGANSVPDGSSFLGYLINDNTWDACENGQIASSPNLPTSSTDAECDSGAKQVSDAIHVFVGNNNGHSQLVYQIPSVSPGDNSSDLVSGKGRYFPKFYKANNHSTLGGVGLNANSNVDYFFGEGFGKPWQSMDISTAATTDGPPLYFGHAYQATNVLSDAINGVLTDIYNAIAGLGNDLLHLVEGLITSQQNNVINQAGVTRAWGQMRIIVDILFILVLIAIAFANTLRINIEQYGIRALLPRFIIAVIGVNFSLILVQIIVDFCTVTSTAFLGNAVGFGRLFQLNLSDFPLSDTVGLIVSIILMVIALLAAAAVVAMLIARIAALWVLASLAPLAFLCLVLPVTRGLWNTWLRNVIRFALIGPLMAVLILLASAFATSQSDAVATDLLTFLIVVGLLYAASIIPLMLGGAITSTAANFANRAQQPLKRAPGQVGRAASRKALTGSSKGQGWVGQGQLGLLGKQARNVPFIGLQSRANADAKHALVGKARQSKAGLSAAEDLTKKMNPRDLRRLGISQYAAAMETSNQASKLDKEFSNLSIPQLHEEFSSNDKVRSLAAARRLTSLGQLGSAGHERELAAIKQKGFENDAEIYKNMRENQPQSAPQALGAGDGDTGDRVAKSSIAKLTASKLDTMSTSALRELAVSNPAYRTLIQQQLSPEFVSKAITGNAATAKTQEVITEAALASPENGGTSLLSDAALTRLVNDKKLYSGANVQSRVRIDQLRRERSDLVGRDEDEGTSGPSAPPSPGGGGPSSGGGGSPGPGQSGGGSPAAETTVRRRIVNESESLRGQSGRGSPADLIGNLGSGQRAESDMTRRFDKLESELDKRMKDNETKIDEINSIRKRTNPNYSAWNSQEGYSEGQHDGEFPVPDEGGEEQE